jgi:hypothetical protein
VGLGPPAGPDWAKVGRRGGLEKREPAGLPGLAGGNGSLPFFYKQFSYLFILLFVLIPFQIVFIQ